MQLVTKRDLIRGIVQTWESRFGKNPERPLVRSTLIHLRQLDLSTATEEDLEAVIGNSSWTRITCCECGSDCDAAVQVGPDTPEVDPIYLCRSCLNQAGRELEEVHAESDTDPMLDVAV